MFIFVLMQIILMRSFVFSPCTSHRLLPPCGQFSERIWPLSDFLGVLPDDVVLSEDEQRPVDGEAVLPDRYGVVQGHGAGTLRFGLLEGWGDATCGHGSPVAVPVALGPSVRRAQQARHVVSEAGHPVGEAKPKEGWKEGKAPESEETVGSGAGRRVCGLRQSGARCCARCHGQTRPDFGRSQSAITFRLSTINGFNNSQLQKNILTHFHIYAFHPPKVAPLWIPVRGAR